MADLISDGNIRVTWCTAIANIAAPTVAELNAGLRLDTIMTVDGLDVSNQTADVPTTPLSGTSNTNLPGRVDYTVKVTVKKQTSGDTASTTLVYGAAGYLVVRRDRAAGTANATADKCEVYPGSWGKQNRAYAPNTIQAYAVDLKVSADPNMDAVVA